MNFLLLALAFLVSAAEEPLQFSGKFHTVYLASKSVGAIAENSPERMLMHEVQFFNEHSVMSMTFYVRKNGICQLHTVWADKLPWNYCTKKGPSVFLIELHIFSNTTIIFQARFVNDLNHLQNMTGALATGTNITQEI